MLVTVYCTPGSTNNKSKIRAKTYCFDKYATPNPPKIKAIIFRRESVVIGCVVSSRRRGTLSHCLKSVTATSSPQIFIATINQINQRMTNDAIITRPKQVLAYEKRSLTMPSSCVKKSIEVVFLTRSCKKENALMRISMYKEPESR